ncbi:hypothetical protein GYMLUDRAFT_46687 [Collybiopsis luxurians FD-317 M1]|uniref:Uncharacterized protein n=1 Tax=Collybiopsis luxurians FD-317 M1 TaxID=944289 RepID=A0A0D0C3V0_9AGAR|nr:hypothetical protein GYMLUDRAFT_46687 [Collybiopsis luxurians FD-317 M1]
MSPKFESRPATLLSSKLSADPLSSLAPSSFQRNDENSSSPSNSSDPTAATSQILPNSESKSSLDSSYMSLSPTPNPSLSLDNNTSASNSLPTLPSSTSPTLASSSFESALSQPQSARHQAPGPTLTNTDRLTLSDNSQSALSNTSQSIPTTADPSPTRRASPNPFDYPPAGSSTHHPPEHRRARIQSLLIRFILVMGTLGVGLGVGAVTFK